ncbi:kynurenine 3-monooxygenase-like [Tubulanus polymorphus]|uniref:kynurenine 3-monooxygenase-like n=1 Tax=Tubulanus polymorphus TaxID=672921 RepID=UPI003DA362EA
MKELKVAVIGGGLVGALETCCLAKRGHQVDLYEGRPDIRLLEHVKGRSINMALSRRGREALRHVGLEDEVTRNGIPMYSRMIHDINGNTKPILYGTPDQFIMSIDRRRLNEILLSGAEAYENVTLHFEHKLVSCDCLSGEVKFMNDGKEVKADYDLIVGCDGAYSMTRRQIMKQTRMNFSQEFIPHGYMELLMPPTSDDDYAMAINHLHIWPRNEYMMIGLPNPDKSFTVTLFMPFSIFESLTTEKQILEFFKDKFPDSIPLLGEKDLVETYLSAQALPLISVKCKPYHIDNKVVILGDAAHAMVPFYGQGMNAGLEDCLVLDGLMDEYSDDMVKVLDTYSQIRNCDAEAICDLAMYNYIEMRKSVNSRLFLLRKRLDNFLHWIMPNYWIPLYTMVSFTRIPYHMCIEYKKKQDRIVKYGLVAAGMCGLFGIGAGIWLYYLKKEYGVWAYLAGRVWKSYW